MAKKRYITNPFIEQLGAVNAASKVMLINVNGELVNSGKTLGELASGVPLVSDNIDDSDPNTKKFVSQGDLDTLSNIAITTPVDLDLLRDSVLEVTNKDLSQYFLDQLSF